MDIGKGVVLDFEIYHKLVATNTAHKLVVYLFNVHHTPTKIKTAKQRTVVIRLHYIMMYVLQCTGGRVLSHLNENTH